MAKKPVPTAEDNLLNKIGQQTGDVSITADAAAADAAANEPMYQKVGDSAVLVAKSRGKLWKSRRDQACSKLEKSGDIAAWDEAIRYYKNDQSRTRSPRYVNRRGDGSGGASLDTAGRSTENIVFANVTALVPATYAKNPDCEITASDKDDEELKAFCLTAKRLINTLASSKAAPGFNLKPKMRKAVVNATLTNLAYIEVGYTFKEQSSEQALQDLQKLSSELQDAKDPVAIREIEGRLSALEDTVDMLRPGGPWVKFRRPHDVLRDGDSIEPDLSDARWCMIRDYISTDYIRAVYAKKNAEGEYESVYKPTHVVGIGTEKSVEEEINSFSLISDDSSYKSFGYDDERSYNKAQRTCVWWVWDRVTQRLELYNDTDWKWPIWVWDDPYKLDSFFPIAPLEFYTDPEYGSARGEVSYYLDQQDEINDMNDLISKARTWARGNLVYNKNIIKDGTLIDKFLEGGEEPRAIGVDVPTDVDLSKIIFAITPPALDHKELFNKDSLLQGIDRVSSVSSVMRGTEFKTNTTNKAIEAYTSQDQTRLDEKIDAIEDCIGDVFWMVLQLCAQHMTQDEVAQVIGSRQSAAWKTMSPQDMRNMVDIKIAGGSSLKPTSSAKKKEAMQMVQVLGQFAKAGAGASIVIALKVLQRAFDELTVTDEDWQMLIEAIQSELQRGQSAPGGAAPGAPASPGAQPAGAVPPAGGAAQSEPGAGVPPDMIMQAIHVVADLINKMDPKLKQALGNALARGVPVEEALPKIIELSQQQQAPPQGQPPIPQPQQQPPAARQ